MTIFVVDMILYIEKPKLNQKKQLINGFSKVARYKINIQKSVAILYINNEFSDKEKNQYYLQ